MSNRSIDAVFFDVRDTLGYVDRPGHLVVYKPTSRRLLSAVQELIGLRIGIITNLPSSVSAEVGEQMVRTASLGADGAVLGDFLDPQGLVINHSVGANKPGARIYQLAAEQMSLPVERCLFVGENLIEVIGAQTAGMHATLKPFPPGGEFKLKADPGSPEAAEYSGRLFETILEEDHLIGKRVTIAASKIADGLEALPAGCRPPPSLLRAMTLLVWLLNEYIDPYHHRVEEETVIPLARARGLPEFQCEILLRQHDQGRAYFKALDVALQRIRGPGFYEPDRAATGEFALLCRAFVTLYKAHGPMENDFFFPAAGKLFDDMDDALVVELMHRIGPHQIAPYLAILDQIDRSIAEPAPATTTPPAEG